MKQYRRVVSKSMLLACASIILVQAQGKTGVKPVSVSVDVAAAKAAKRYVRVGSKAPGFTAEAVIGGLSHDVTLHKIPGYKVLFFYPKDFIFVCPTELRALHDAVNEFAKRNCQVFAISTDSAATHKSWLDTPRDKGGLGMVDIPLISDETKNIAREYGVLADTEDVAQRAVFVIDGENIIRALIVTDDSIGRSTSELLRLLDALDFSSKHGQVCPMNWHAGDDGMDKNKQGVIDYFASHGSDSDKDDVKTSQVSA